MPSRALPVLCASALLVLSPPVEADSSTSTAARSASTRSGAATGSPRATTNRRTRGRGSVQARRTPAGRFRSGVPGGPFSRWFRRADRDRRDRASRPESESPAVVGAAPTGPPATLRITGLPDDASVYVDDVWVGRGRDLALPGARIELAAGFHDLRVAPPDVAARIEVEPGEELSVMFAQIDHPSQKERSEPENER